MIDGGCTLNLRLKTSVEVEVLCDDTRKQRRNDVRIGKVYLNIISLQAVLEPGRKFTIER